MAEIIADNERQLNRVVPSNAIQRCLETLAQHAKSFYFASHVLPRGGRAEAAVLYAWCRFADDAIDLAPREAGPDNLARLGRELDDIYARRPQSDLVLAAFQQVVHARGLPRAYPAELIAGLAMDITKDRYATLDELLLYSYRVAGTVGLMMCHVLGVSDETALRRAAHLGIAMQLTNICRDVREDWERGRLYLPLDLLSKAGAPGLDVHLGGDLPVVARAPIATVVRQLLTEADRFYQSADQGIAALSPRCALAVRTARLVYAAIGGRIAARGYDALSGRAFVPLGRKLGLLARAVAVTAMESLRRGRRSFRATRITRELRYPDDVLPL
jgi:15-cis-phytoene synthase